MEQQNNKSKWMKPAYQVVADLLTKFIVGSNSASLKQVQERASVMINISTEKVYSEVNGLLLAIDAVTKGYEANVYGTIKQINFAKRVIKPGEQATLLLMINETDKGKKVVLRSVFNIEQTIEKQAKAS